MTYVVIAEYRAVETAVEQVADALQQMIAPSRAEPGNVAYQPCRSPSEPAAFMIYEEYVDEAAFTAHTESKHFGRWLRGVVLPNLTERVRHDLVPMLAS